ncbi:protein translocase subunit SecD [Candidatus Amesbacteria bacterium]|nr:protein translocase subunit SecD [Candidatus Amesbacteria bacterium]
MKTRIILVLTAILFSLWANLPGQIKIKNWTWNRPTFPKRDLSLKLGLDLQGGVHLAYSADVSKIPVSDQSAAVDSTRANIERRINLLGVSEPIIQTSKIGNDYRILIELAGVTDIDNALKLIGQTAQLEFRESKVATPSAATDFVSTGLTGADLQRAQVQFGNGKSSVGLEFTPEGGKKFAEITKRNIDKPLAVFLDEKVVTAPNVSNAIADGKAVITGNFTVDEAKQLVIQLNAGALPLPIKIVEQRNVGATLGADSITRSLYAGAMGLLIVCIFMIANYGVKGVLANIALVLYVFLSLAVIKLVPVTLTLAGIAGLILSIGMAVDANILIFERIKEELVWGRPRLAAIELGFHRAWNSIRDSNISSLMTAGILFWFGSGSVRGFALTLIIGVLVSLFSAITVTKFLLNLVYRK